MLKQACLCVGIFMVLVACSPNNEPVKIAEPQLEALEKAKEVALSEERISEETKKAIDEQTQ